MAPFAGNSDYKETFKAHALPPKHQRQKVEWTKPVDPFDATTTMSKDFQVAFAWYMWLPLFCDNNDSTEFKL